MTQPYTLARAGGALRSPLLPWVAAWILVALAGAVLLVRIDIGQRRELFQSDARIAHRLLDQRVAQHEAILATLVLLDGGPDRPGAPELRLPAIYPQVLSVLRRTPGERWPDPVLDAAERTSRAARRAALGGVDVATGEFTLVHAGSPASYALRVDASRMIPWDEWPFGRDDAVRVELVQEDKVIVLQTGPPAGSQPLGLTPGFVFARTLAAPGQPFELRLQRATGPAQWPWLGLAGWLAVVTTAAVAGGALRRGRRERRRAEELLRVGRTARLGTLGEIAAGIAHELNQPLAAVLANAAAVRRLLEEDPPEIATARAAVAQTAAQARRAADVVRRLRRLVEVPDGAADRRAVSLDAMGRDVVDLLEPELRRRGIAVTLRGTAPPVLADPVALEQIVHNLVDNAMRALDEVPAAERRLVLEVGVEADRGVLRVIDSGRGMTPEALARAFEPFFSTRPGGLGLGLPLCESLAESMGGALRAANAEPRGASFALVMPLAASGDAGSRQAQVATDPLEDAR